MKGRYSTFSQEEYDNRAARAMDLMKASKIDALLVTAEMNYSYFTGHRTHSAWSTFTRPHVFVLTRDGKSTMITHSFTRPEAESRSWIETIVEYGSLVGDAVPEIKNTLKNLGLAGATIGCELGYEQRLGLPQLAWLEIQKAFPKASFVDASGLLWDLRVKKSDAEIDCLRRACRATSKAFEECYSQIGKGSTEEDAARIMSKAMLDEGAESPGFNIICSGKENYERISARPTNRALEDGDLIWIDASAVVEGYWSDFCRVAVVGGPNQEQIRLQKIVRETTEAAIEIIKPGVPVKAVAEMCAKVMGSYGFDLSFDAGRCGHGIGLMSTEPPHIATYDESVLEEGMVITVEPGIVNEEGVFVIEENVAVTGDGFEVLSGASREIYTI
ncbi:MAG: aminopeptidase P family protein [Firmicutes bacterium]|nr:aminopeptidase P family protein [Bacillota bacterium]